MHEHIQTNIDQLNEHHIDAILENMTTHALLTALLTGKEVEEHHLMELMSDHIQELLNA